MTPYHLCPLKYPPKRSYEVSSLISLYYHVHRDTFPDAAAELLPSTQQLIKKISSFVMYVDVGLEHVFISYSKSQPCKSPGNDILPVFNLLNHHSKAAFNTLHFGSRQPTPPLRPMTSRPQIKMPCLG